MSILIKGANVPKSCYECYCTYLDRDDTDIDDVWHCSLTGGDIDDYVRSKYDRPSFCPIVEIPPHGDLIDRNELMKSLEHEWNICMDDTEFANKIVPNSIKNAPTIIKGE